MVLIVLNDGDKLDGLTVNIISLDKDYITFSFENFAEIMMIKDSNYEIISQDKKYFFNFDGEKLYGELIWV